MKIINCCTGQAPSNNMVRLLPITQLGSCQLQGQAPATHVLLPFNTPPLIILPGQVRHTCSYRTWLGSCQLQGCHTYGFLDGRLEKAFGMSSSSNKRHKVKISKANSSANGQELVLLLHKIKNQLVCLPCSLATSHSSEVTHTYRMWDIFRFQKYPTTLTCNQRQASASLNSLLGTGDTAIPEN